MWIKMNFYLYKLLLSLWTTEWSCGKQRGAICSYLMYPTFLYFFQFSLSHSPSLDLQKYKCMELGTRYSTRSGIYRVLFRAKAQEPMGRRQPYARWPHASCEYFVSWLTQHPNARAGILFLIFVQQNIFLLAHSSLCLQLAIILLLFMVHCYFILFCHRFGEYFRNNNWACVDLVRKQVIQLIQYKACWQRLMITFDFNRRFHLTCHACIVRGQSIFEYGNLLGASFYQSFMFSCYVWMAWTWNPGYFI